MVLSGIGDMQLKVLVCSFRKDIRLTVSSDSSRFRTVRQYAKKVKVQGKHKKQSGGHGQYGDVWIEF